MNEEMASADAPLSRPRVLTRPTIAQLVEHVEAGGPLLLRRVNARGRVWLGRAYFAGRAPGSTWIEDTTACRRLDDVAPDYARLGREIGTRTRRSRANARPVPHRAPGTLVDRPGICLHCGRDAGIYGHIRTVYAKRRVLRYEFYCVGPDREPSPPPSPPPRKRPRRAPVVRVQASEGGRVRSGAEQRRSPFLPQPIVFYSPPPSPPPRAPAPAPRPPTPPPPGPIRRRPPRPAPPARASLSGGLRQFRPSLEQEAYALVESLYRWNPASSEERWRSEELARRIAAGEDPPPPPYLPAYPVPSSFILAMSERCQDGRKRWALSDLGGAPPEVDGPDGVSDDPADGDDDDADDDEADVFLEPTDSSTHESDAEE